MTVEWKNASEELPLISGNYFVKNVLKSKIEISTMYYNELEESFMSYTDVGGTDCSECGGYNHYHYGSHERADFWAPIELPSM